MYTHQTFKTVVAVNLRECSKIDDLILRDVKKIEGSCINVGFVKKGSVQVISRSIGTTHAINTSGDIYFDVVFSAEIFNPLVGQTLNCVVDKVNKLGVMAYGIDDIPVCVIIARQHHENTFRECSEREEIECEVVGSRFNINDREIQVIGKFT